MLVETLKVVLTGDTKDLEKAIFKANAAFELMEKAIGAVTEFVADSVKAFAEQEKATKQLALVVGEATSAFEDQAEVIEKSLGVDSKKTMALQAMLVRFGAAPADVEKTTRAIIDYATATGQDAVSAGESLIRNLEKGSGKWAEAGITYDNMGSKANALSSAVSALGERFGGAAAANANTLSGRIEKLASHWDDLKKAFGGFINVIDEKLGVLKKLAELFDYISGASEGKKTKELERNMLVQRYQDFTRMSPQQKGDYFRNYVGSMQDPESGTIFHEPLPGDMPARIAELTKELGGVRLSNKAGGHGNLAAKVTPGEHDDIAKAASRQVAKAREIILEGRKWADDAMAQWVKSSVGIEDWDDALKASEALVKKTAEEEHRLKVEGAKIELDAIAKKIQDEKAARNKALLDSNKGFMQEMADKMAPPRWTMDADGNPVQVINSMATRVSAAIGMAGIQMTQRLGEFGRVMNSAIQGMQQGGWVGAIVAVVAELVMMADGFKQFQEANDKMMKGLVAAMNEGGLGELFNILSRDVIGSLKMLTPVFRIVGKLFGAISKVLATAAPLFVLSAILFEALLKPIEFLFTGLGEVLSRMINIIMPIMFDAGKMTIGWILSSLNGIKQLYNNIVDWLAKTLDDVGNAFGPVGGGFHKLAESVRKATIKGDGLDDAIAYLESLTLAGVTATLNETAARDKSTEAIDRFTDSLTNVPSGFRVAAARYHATAAVGAGGGTFGPGNFTGFGSKGSTVVKVYIDSKEVAAATSETMAENEGREYGGKSGRWGER